MAFLDDFAGLTDDDKFSAVMASTVLELTINRPVTLTQTVNVRSNLTICGSGKFSNTAPSPVYVQKTTTGNLFNAAATVYDFHIKNLAMIGNSTASQCVNFVGTDECSVRDCLIKDFIDEAIMMESALKCLSDNNRISASSARNVGARGVMFWRGGNVNRCSYTYISGYSTGFDSQCEAAVAEQVTIESADVAFRVSGGDCAIRGGVVNACTKAIVQAGSFWVKPDFVRNANAANCVVLDSGKWAPIWNGA